jgi:transposase-like protein
VDDIVKAMGIDGIYKSQVSVMAKELDAGVEAFRSRPLDAGPYTYVWMDALTQKVREGGRVVNVAVVIATAVNAEGRRECLGFDVITTEDGAGWTAFLRSLVARGLCGVALVTSDDHKGLKAASWTLVTLLVGQATDPHWFCHSPSMAARVSQVVDQVGVPERSER